MVIPIVISNRDHNTVKFCSHFVNHYKANTDIEKSNLKKNLKWQAFEFLKNN